MSFRAAVTGLGAVSGLGLGVEALWQGLCQGQQIMRPYAALSRIGLAGIPIAMVPLLEDRPAETAEDGSALLSSAPRALYMTEQAAAEALADAGFSDGLGLVPRLGICIGTTLGEKAGWVDALRKRVVQGDEGAFAAAELGCAAPTKRLARRYGATQVRTVSSACASANGAIGVALNWIREDRCDVVLCGGVDALQQFVLAGFASLRALAKSPCRPFDAERSGLNLGEGAAFLVLESPAHAIARGRQIRAFLDGSGAACDAHHMTGPDREGRGAARAMIAALTDARLAAAEIDFVSAHGTGTIFNDLMEAKALHAVFAERTATIPVNSIKGALGHTLGASGALEAVMAVRLLEEQRIPPTAGHHRLDLEIALDIVAGRPRDAAVRHLISTSSGFGGLNAALVFSSANSSLAGGRA